MTKTLQPTRYPLTAFSVGDTIQHYRRFWPAQTITAIHSIGIFRPMFRVSLSGGSSFTCTEIDSPLFLREVQM